MNTELIKSVNQAIKWYQSDNKYKPDSNQAHRDILKTNLQIIQEQAEKDKQAEDARVISMMINYLESGKELKLLPVPDDEVIL
ncbi:hypothetical protein K6R71_000489 [Salmonella enterica]|nr:hypothetical protein [Salmonella enterica]